MAKSKIEQITQDNENHSLEYPEFESDEMFRMFGTYKLFAKRHIDIKWEEFQTKEITEWINELLQKIPVTHAIVMCRRHPEFFAYFLKFFDRSPSAACNPKIYLPFLCQWIQLIPIQWIVHHILRIRDHRYAFQFAISAYAGHITISSSTAAQNKQRKVIWEQLLRICPNLKDQSTENAWNKLCDLRASLKDLRELKLEKSLSEYIRFDKPSFMKRLMFNIPNSNKLSNFIRQQAIPFCNINGIPIEGIVIASVVKREWEVNQKLQILTQYVHDTNNLTMALETMSFRNSEELEMIREYASQKEIPFEPDPTNFIRCMMSPIGKKMSRSTSQESMDISLNSSKLTRVPSEGSIDVSSYISRGSLSSLADGEPKDASMYTEKLRKYATLKEITPIFKLASKYETVISYDTYNDTEEKPIILMDIIKRKGVSKFKNIVKLLDISSNEIMNIVFTEPFFKSYCIDLIPSLLKFVTRSNTQMLLEYVKNSIDEIQSKIEIGELAKLWKQTFVGVAPYSQGSQMIEFSNSIAVLAGIPLINNSKLQIEAMNMFKKMRNFAVYKEFIEQNNLQPFFTLVVDNTNRVSGAQLDKAFLSHNVDDLCIAIQSIQLMPLRDQEMFLTGILSKISGFDYCRLSLAYHMLTLTGRNFPKDIPALNILISSDIEGVNFHHLIRNPSPVLQDAVTQDNVYELIAIGSIFGINTDDIILSLMANKMSSTNLDDYLVLIAKLTHKSSGTKMLNSLKGRFKGRKLVEFYQALGYVDLMREAQNHQILAEASLSEFDTNDMLLNPSVMICEIYSKADLQAKFGPRLHKICQELAHNNNLSITKIREHLVHTWLIEDNPKECKESTSIFIENCEELKTKDDQVNIQKALFIARLWPLRTAIKWLILFIYQEDPKITFRAKSKAMACLFTIATVDEIASVFKGNVEEIIGKQRRMYLCRMLEIWGNSCSENDFKRENINSTIRNLCRKIDNPGVAETLFSICTEFGIQDKELLISSMQILCVKRKHFLLQNYIPMINSTGFNRDDDLLDFFIRAISATFTELANREPQTRPIKALHNSIIRDTLDAYSISPLPIQYLYYNEERVTLVEMSATLIKQGFPQLAAEFGAHVIDPKKRNGILLELVQNCHFDNCLQYGFDEDLVFDYILKERLEEATEQMMDASFNRFTAWLKENNENDALKEVQNILAQQGRTMEIKRMFGRLHMTAEQ